MVSRLFLHITGFWTGCGDRNGGGARLFNQWFLSILLDGQADVPAINDNAAQGFEIVRVNQNVVETPHQYRVDRFFVSVNKWSGGN